MRNSIGNLRPHYIATTLKFIWVMLDKKGSDNTIEVSFTTRDGSVVTVANRGNQASGSLDGGPAGGDGTKRRTARGRSAER